MAHTYYFQWVCITTSQCYKNWGLNKHIFSNFLAYVSVWAKAECEKSFSWVSPRAAAMLVALLEDLPPVYMGVGF